MLRKALSMVVTVCILCTGLCVYAATSFSAVVSYLPADGEITVSGTAARGDVVVMIAPQSTAPEKMTEDILPTVIKQFKVSGAYSVLIGMPEGTPGGKYNIYVSHEGEEITDSFIYMNIAAAEAAIPEINAANGAEFASIVSKNAVNLGIDTDDAGYIAEAANIFEIMDNMTFENTVDFYNKYIKTYAVCMIEGEENLTEVESLLEKYASNLGIDYTDDFAEDNKLTPAAKSELLFLLTIVNFADKTDEKGNIDFGGILEELKPVAVIRTVSNWVGLKEAINVNFVDEFAEMISADSNYEKIKDKDLVYEEMMKNKFTSMEDIELIFTSAVNIIYDKENKTESNGSSVGRGNSGGSLTSGITTPPASEIRAEEEAEIVLIDMNETHWAYVAVMSLAADSVISGYEDGTFRSSNYITRAEFTKMILSFAKEIQVGQEVTFDDVNATDWYYTAVTQAASKGLVSGTGEGFCPNAYIKREDAALIVYRLLNSLGKSPVGYRPFADRKDISPYAKDAVYALGGAYIVQGNEDNMFLPQNNITRAEAAQIIYNALKR